MQQKLPPLNWLRAFEASARHLSFTGAARELNMTQSAVSQQIKALEGHLGRPLFHRRARALELTLTGLSYVPIVRDAFSTLSRGTASITGGGRNVVQFHSNMSFASFWLAPRIGRFYARHPDVRLNIVADIWEPQSMPMGADLEVRYSVHSAPDARAERLFDDRIFPVVAPGWEGRLEDVAKAQLFEVSYLVSTWSVWAEHIGLDWPDPPVTYASTYAVSLSAAMAGAGLAMAHDTVAGGLLREGQLVRPFTQSAPMKEGYFLLRPEGEARPAVSAFEAWLREEAAADQSGREATQA